MAHDLLGSIGFSDGLSDAFSIVRFPIAAAAMVLAFDIVYRYAPNASGRPSRTAPGAAVGAALWLLLSLGFFLYVANFGSYGATYGAFAGAIVLLLWLYLSSIAFLLGGELNAQLDRGRAAPAPAASCTDRPGPGT